jgi:hypothetical protein
MSVPNKNLAERYPVTTMAIIGIGSLMFPTIVLPIIGCTVIVNTALAYDRGEYNTSLSTKPTEEVSTDKDEFTELK